MKYLPIGSVVILRDGGQPVMIYGRKQMQGDNQALWDYVACLYPEGNLGEKYNVFFNSEDIDKVIFTGFQTQIDSQMQQILNKM